MTGKAVIGGVVGIVALALASSVFAQPDVFDSKLSASVFNTKLVQAFDECPGPDGVTIIGGIGGIGGCPIVHNTTADDAMMDQFNIGKIVLKNKFSASQVIGILKSSGTGDNKRQLAGKTFRVEFVLRVTKRTTGSGVITQPVTWVDQELHCPSVALPMDGKGNFLFKGDLTTSPTSGCGLDNNLNKQEYNREVVAARITDVTNPMSPKIVAVPGIRNKKAQA